MGKKEKSYDEINRLVERAIQGERDALALLCEQEGRNILYFCSRLMGGLQQGEDAAQEVLIQVYKNISSLRAPEAFRVWLNQITVYTCRRLLKQEKRHANMMPIDEYLDSIPEEQLWMIPQEYVESDEKKQRLLAIIDEFPTGMKACVHLYYFEDLPAAQIAEVLGSSEKAVNSQLYRARLKIRAEIEKDRQAAGGVEAMVPMAALGTLMQQQAGALITAEMVSGLLQGATVAKQATLLKAVYLALKTVTAATVTVSVGTAALVYSGTAAAPPLVSNPVSRPGSVLDVPQHSESRLEDRLEYTASSLEDAGQSASPPVSIPSTPVGAPPILEEASGPAPAPGNSAVSSERQAVVEPDPPPLAERPPSPAPPQTDVVLTGRVQIAAAAAPGQQAQQETRVLSSGEASWAAAYFPKIRVELASAGQEIPETTFLTPQGEFTFVIPADRASGEYRARLLVPNDIPLIFAGQTRDGTVNVSLGGGQSSIPVEFFLSGSETRFTLLLQSDDCPCGHVNPRTVRLTFSNNLPVTVRWSLQDPLTRRELRSGSGAAITRRQLLGENTPEGNYLLVVQVTDVSGNTESRTQMLSVVSGFIDEGEFE